MVPGGDERSELTAFVTVAFNAVGLLQGDAPFVLPSRVSLAGLRTAVGDVLEMTAALNPSEQVEVDRQLADAGAPSLTAIRLRYSKRLAGIVERGVIRSEAEYHLVRNFAEVAAAEASGAVLWALLERYEKV